MKDRADKVLYEKGFTKSRTEAQSLIERGYVFVDGTKIEKSSTAIATDAVIEITQKLPYVSRAGEKLKAALDAFKIKVQNMVVLDIGSSTGGFVDCLVQEGALKVYAVDVGRDQLDPRIRLNKKVIVMEQTDIRKALIPEKVDLITIDVSFISLSHVLPILSVFLKTTGNIIALIKPQFEVGPGVVNKKGVVEDEALHKKVIRELSQISEKLGYTIIGIIDSPIMGSEGNKEYLLYLTSYHTPS